MPAYEELLDELSDLYGIVPEYCDIFGNRHAAPASTKISILKAMKLRTGSADDLHLEITRKRTRQWKRLIDPTMVIPVTGQPLELIVHAPVREGDEKSVIIKCALIDESGRRELFSFDLSDIEIVERKVIEDVPHLKIRLLLRQPGPE